MCTNADAAMLEYFSKDLRIQDPCLLYMLLMLMKFIACGTTDDDVGDRWLVVQKCLDLLILDSVLKDKLVSYITKQWLCETWRYVQLHPPAVKSD